MLTAEQVTVAYRGVTAVRGVDLEVPPGSLVGIVGANGAGKSSLIKALTGAVQPTGGSIHWQGRDMTGAAPATFVKAGVVSVPEGRRFFPELTVEQNLLLGAWTQPRTFDDESLERCFELFEVLAAKRRHHASSLSGGEQQMLCIAQAIMARPAALIVDEPSLGLAPLLVEALLDRLLRFAREEQLAVLVAEQAVGELLRVADHVTVLERGSVVVAGATNDIRDRPEVRAAYLGA